MLSKFSTQSRPKTMPELTERQWRIYNFLHSNPVGVLSSVTPDNDPHGAVIYFSIDKSFNAFFITKSQTRKNDNLKRNDHVMLTVFEAVSQTTAQIIGTASEVTETTAINAVAATTLGASMKTSDAGLPPISKLQAGNYVAYQIIPSQIRMAVYSRPDPGDYSDLFDSVESFELKPA